MSKTYIEWTDDIATGDRIIHIRLSKVDMATAKFDNFDRALFDDIENGKESDTPMADRLLGLETMVRRIEESAKSKSEKENTGYIGSDIVRTKMTENTPDREKLCECGKPKSVHWVMYHENPPKTGDVMELDETTKLSMRYHWTVEELMDIQALIEQQVLIGRINELKFLREDYDVSMDFEPIEKRIAELEKGVK